MIGVVVLALGAGGGFAYKKFRERSPANKSQALKRKNFWGVKKGTTNQACKSEFFAD